MTTSTPRTIQRTYLLLQLGNTLAASFIWGINTMLLLDAGLSNLEAFAANAAFTAGMVLFEVPTGIVADMVGRRASYLLGTVTLSVATLLYVLLWQVGAPFAIWAAASVLIGLGYTFFSGAVEAWLVDALGATGFTGELETVFGRGQVVAGAAMLTGTIGGGALAQATSLGVPFLLRAALLAVMFVVAFRLMHDVGFTPADRTRPLAAMRAIATASIDHGWRVPAVKWLMVESLITGGVAIYGFYALQPYLLELYGDPHAYFIAGLSAAIVAGAQILGGLAAPRIGRLFPRRASALVAIGGGERRDHRAGRARRQLLGRDRAEQRLGAAVRGHDADPPGLPERHDPLAPASHDPLVRLAHGLGRRRLGPAGARPRRRRMGLRALVPRRGGDRGHRRAVPGALGAPRGAQRRGHDRGRAAASVRAWWRSAATAALHGGAD